jgi:uncharacterized membrane protein YgcG
MTTKQAQRDKAGRPRPAAASSGNRLPLGFPVFLGFLAAVVVLIPARNRVAPLAVLGIFLLGAVTPLLVTLLFRQVRRWIHRPSSKLLGWLGLLLIVALIFGERSLMVSLRLSTHQRCVDSVSLKVLPLHWCQAPDGYAGPGYSEWYYGGTGFQVGQEVQGGDITPAEDQGGGGTGGGGGGDSGDDGGDDGGGDGGGDG